MDTQIAAHAVEGESAVFTGIPGNGELPSETIEAMSEADEMLETGDGMFANPEEMFKSLEM